MSSIKLVLQVVINFFLMLLELFLFVLSIPVLVYLLIRLYYGILATLEFRPILDLNKGVLSGLLPWIEEAVIPMILKDEDLKILATIFVANIGLYFLFRRTRTAEQNLKTFQEDITITRLSRAVNQIGDELPQMRTGDIIGLEKILETQEEQRKNIAQTLSEYIRQHAPKKEDATEKMNWKKRQSIEVAIKSLVRIGEYISGDKKKFCDLRETNLSDLHFYGIDLSSFQLLGANLTNACLQEANFKNAELDGVDFSSADFRNTQGLTQKQLDKSYYREGLPPRNLPDRLTIPERKLK